MKAQVLFENILRDNGYSITKARALIFRLLLGANQPWPMNRLIEEAKGNMDRVSVYRTVELFEKLGVVQRIHLGWKYKLELSEIFLDHHHHMTCLMCGRIVPVKDEPAFEETIKRLGQENGFALTSHQLEMQGYCAMCQTGAKRQQ